MKTPNTRSSRPGHPVFPMGPKSRRRGRSRPRTGQHRQGGETVGRDGYATRVEGEVGRVQDSAGDEGGGGDWEECYGEGSVFPFLRFSFFGGPRAGDKG